MQGEFPVMMFGLPAAALAIYQTAKPENKKVVGGISSNNFSSCIFPRTKFKPEWRMENMM
jgi:phosphotransferase system  glucose/maltose/N-acetylglucosamine-specific IIC component